MARAPRNTISTAMHCRPHFPFSHPRVSASPRLRVTPSPRTMCDTLGAVEKNKEFDEASMGRLRRFAEIYRERMKGRPYMEILARYDSMTEAGLLVGEREQADVYLDTHRLNELLYPEKLSVVVNEG